jgi:hypothetical protein
MKPWKVALKGNGAVSSHPFHDKAAIAGNTLQGN